MSFLDTYRGKGRILVAVLKPAERQELSVLLGKSVEEQDESGLVIYKTLANVPENLAIRVPDGRIVAFESGPPREKAKPFFAAEIKPEITMGYTKMKPIKMTPTQSKEAAERYSRELAAAGIDIKTLGKPPTPATNQATETRRVLTGQRKAALVDEATANQAKQWGLNAFKVPHGVFTGSVAQSKAYIIYLPGQAEKAKKVVEVLQRYPIGKRGPGYLAELGNALGIPPSETNEYIKTYYGEKKSGSPAWLGLLGLAFLVILLVKKQPVASGVVSPPDQYLPEIYKLENIWIPQRTIYPD